MCVRSLLVALRFLPALQRVVGARKAHVRCCDAVALVQREAVLFGSCRRGRTRVPVPPCRGLAGVLAVGLLLPCTGQAAVIINEIAWMGTKASANDEWIELHNTGTSAVDVSGWELSDGDALTIPLSGTLAGGAYAVLERTDDTTAPGAAFLTYTGALNNGGATLTLRDADAGVADQVFGGEGWEQIGGDNDTKHTAQFTQDGWQTAAPTPGVANTAPPAVDEQTEPTEADPAGQGSSAGAGSANTSEDDDDDDDGGGGGDPHYLTLADVELGLDIAAPSRAYVNQPVSMQSRARGLGSSILNSLSYRWNFGEGTAARGSAAEHTYAFPGTYVVTLHAGYGRHEQVARHELTVLPVRLELARDREGNILLSNTAPYEVDLSGYRLRGERTLTFPPYSRLLDNQTITIAAERVGASTHTLVALFDPARTLVTSHLPEASARLAGRGSAAPAAARRVEMTSAPLLSDMPLPEHASAQPTTTASSAFTFATAPPRSTATLQRAAADSVPANVSTTSEPAASVVTRRVPTSSRQLAAAGTAASTLPTRWPYLVLAGFLAVGTLAVFARSGR